MEEICRSWWIVNCMEMLKGEEKSFMEAHKSESLRDFKLWTDERNENCEKLHTANDRRLHSVEMMLLIPTTQISSKQDRLK